MTTNDTATRRVTTGIVLAVGLSAGSDSYSHIYTLARDHGQAIASAALLPLAGDGLIAAASSAMLVASRQGRDVPVLARVMLLAGIGSPSPSHARPSAAASATPDAFPPQLLDEFAADLAAEITWHRHLVPRRPARRYERNTKRPAGRYKTRKHGEATRLTPLTRVVFWLMPIPA